MSATTTTRSPAAEPRPGDALGDAVEIDPSKLEELLATASGFVGEGALPSLQLALAHRGSVIATRAFGGAQFGSGASEGERAADEGTLYTAFSSTKALVAAAAWLLWQDGCLALDESVADIVPGFGDNGKASVRVEHLFTHTCGFPNAPFAPLDWNDPERRLARLRSWRLDWEPGSRFVYHRTTSMWVLAELIERRTGGDFRAFVRERILIPLGLEDLHLGLPAELGNRVANVVYVGAPTPRETLASLGLELPSGLVDDEKYFVAYNRSDVRAVGAPASGAVTTAAALALFYQGLLHDARAVDGGHRVWRPETLEMALRPRTGDLVDPMTRKRASRALGVVVAGDDDRVYRGFGSSNSPLAFGHAGAGGQVAWADPASGLSFVCLTNGFDRDVIRLGMRGIVLSTLAASCLR